jgi:hypothetical protein
MNSITLKIVQKKKNPKKAIRIMTHSTYNAQTNPLKKHKILPYAYYIEHNLAPSSLGQKRHQRSQRLLPAFTYRTETYKKIYILVLALPAAWNLYRHTSNINQTN